MARSHAKIYASIWFDEDWRQASASAQRLYFVLLSQPHLSLVGVLEYRATKLARLAADTTTENVDAALCELVERGYVVYDETTDEVLIRSFMEYDIAPARLNSNVLKGLWSAWRAVESRRLRTQILHLMPPGLWKNEKCATPLDAVEWKARNPWPQPLNPQDETVGANRTAQLAVEPPSTLAVYPHRVDACAFDWVPVEKQERREAKVHHAVERFQAATG